MPLGSSVIGIIPGGSFWGGPGCNGAAVPPAGASVVAWRKTAGASIRDKDGAARLGRICWTRNSGTLTFGVSTAGDPCNSPATAADPLLVYNTSANGWRIDRGAFSRSDTTCPGTQICYTGVAIIYNANSVSIEETVTSLCGVANSNCTAGNEKFPTNDLMALLTPGNVSVAATTTNVVARVMAMLYAGTDFVSRSVVPATPTRIVGGVAASRFCFGGGGACPGGTSNAPEIYQAPLNGSSLNATPPVADRKSVV